MLFFDIAALILGVWAVRQSRAKNMQTDTRFAYGAMGLLVLSALPILAFGIAQSAFGLFEGNSGLGLGLIYFFGGLIAKILIVVVAVRVKRR
jgi:hypothetical protein